MSAASTLAHIVAAIEQRYPLDGAEPWDAVGLVCGDPAAPVRRILWAVDPVEAVVDQAIGQQVDLVITHHPLLLTGVHSVAATDAKGRIVHRLISSGIALYCAHTNADIADPGVSDALALTLGVTDTRPLDPSVSARQDGTAVPSGLGRIGHLPAPMPLRAFAETVLSALPVTHHGARVLGDPDDVVRTVAVCGGSGDALLTVATASGADVYVTADLKHHRALEHRDEGGCAVIDVAHWASEWPWLAQAAELLDRDLAAQGAAVDSLVSDIPTDPWTFSLRSAP
ncbi:MAG: Nif3-like dinuclear metal center hexameric protein [Actinobacteria bacterium]|nr:Nif3-like dinuclear metal center hexameric protein [Actinomycetota bacterium]